MLSLCVLRKWDEEPTGLSKVFCLIVLSKVFILIQTHFPLEFVPKTIVNKNPTSVCTKFDITLLFIWCKMKCGYIYFTILAVNLVQNEVGLHLFTFILDAN